jgi:hypothetical protein
MTTPRSAAARALMSLNEDADGGDEVADDVRSFLKDIVVTKKCIIDDDDDVSTPAVVAAGRDDDGDVLMLVHNDATVRYDDRLLILLYTYGATTAGESSSYIGWCHVVAIHLHISLLLYAAIYIPNIINTLLSSASILIKYNNFETQQPYTY